MKQLATLIECSLLWFLSIFELLKKQSKNKEKKMSIAFIDLLAQKKALGDKIDNAVQKVLDGGHYIMGPEVSELEQKLAEFVGSKYCVSCASGTDALLMPLTHLKLNKKDAVFVPAFTFTASAETVAQAGATPYFIDVLKDTYNLDPKSLRAAIAEAKEKGYHPAGILMVDIFGQAADVDEITKIAEEHNLWILDDAAQSFGAEYNGKRLGKVGFATSTSFFPAKPLGCYGDGGAIFTDDEALFEDLKSLRVHGQNKDDKYNNIQLGFTGRLDTIQAAILLAKLEIFPDEIKKRQEIAKRYNEALKDVCQVPVVKDDYLSVWAQYTITLKEGERDELIKKLTAAGIPTACYYPIPLHKMKAYEGISEVVGGELPVCDFLSTRVISLPMHPYLDEATQNLIIDEVKKALA